MKPPIFTFLIIALSTIFINAQNPCQVSLPNFEFIGEMNGHNYYLSNEAVEPEAAQIDAALQVGYLAVINNEVENNFIQQNISEMVYIGLNDVATEGDLVWEDGSNFSYSNFDICSFCNANSDELDYVMMHPWNGGWSWSSKWNPRKYILEIPCEESADLSLMMTTSKTTAQEDEQFVISLLLTNHGPNAATNIWTQYVNGTFSMSTLLNETTSHGTITDVWFNVKDWNIDHLPVGETAELNFIYKADVGAPGYFYALADVKQVDQNDPDSTPGNNQSYGAEDDDDNISVIFTDHNCQGEISGFVKLGEFGNSVYYVSETNAINALDAQEQVGNYGGNLASINSEAENYFVLQGISEMTYIGLNDRQNEGVLEWYDGSPVDYTNFNFCSFCNENSNAFNNVVMHQWDGTWSWSNTSNPRKFVMEIPCGIATGADLALSISASENEIAVGGSFEVTLDITNNGPDAATNILLKIWRSEYAELISGGPTAGTFEYDFYLNYNWEIPILQSGETAELILNCVATASPFNTYSLGCYVSELDQIDPISSNDNVSVGLTKITQGGCPNSIPEFTLLGEFNNSRYYLSENIARPLDAQTIAASYGGWLATPSSQSENDFLQQNISEVAYIGLNDFYQESVLEWFSGEPVDFTNFDLCNICYENETNMDFVMMHPWNGGWSWSNYEHNRKYIIEIPCSNTSSINLDNTLIAMASENVSKIDFTELYPNPAEKIIHIKIKSDEEKTIELQIWNAQGKRVQIVEMNLFKGENSRDINIYNLPAGIYFLRSPNIIGKEKGIRFVKIRD